MAGHSLVVGFAFVDHSQAGAESLDCACDVVVVAGVVALEGRSAADRVVAADLAVAVDVAGVEAAVRDSQGSQAEHLAEGHEGRW